MKPFCPFSSWFLTFVAAIFCFAHPVFGQTITIYAAGIGDNLSATVYGRSLETSGVAVDGSGNCYFSDGNGRLRKLSPTGILTTIEGTNYGGSGGSAFGSLDIYDNISPSGVTLDNSGNIYVTGGNQVFKISSSGIVTTIAGVTACCSGFSGDGSLATNARLSSPVGIAVDNSGNIYVADQNNNRIRKINTSGIINTIAGGGSAIGDGGPAVSAQLNSPTGVAIDATGNVYIADNRDRRIRKVNTSGVISTIAGTGGCCGFTGVGGPATAANIGQPYDVKVDAGGNVFFSTDWSNVCKVNTSGTLSIVAGISTNGYTGNGGTAVSAQLYYPQGIALDPSGNVFICDSRNQCIRKVNTAGIIDFIAGNGLPLNGFAGDGVDARLAEFNVAEGLSSDYAGNIYIADAGNNRVRKINTSGIITTIAGSGIVGFFGDSGPAIAAELDQPVGTALDHAGNIYIADFGTSHIRKVNTVGIISTIAGGGTGGLGDGGAAIAAVISADDVAADSAGNVYIADGTHFRVRRVDALTGIITTIAGNGTNATAGDGGPATLAELFGPSNVAVDRYGNVYVSAGVIRKINTSGIISTFANLSGDITIDSIGNLYVANSNTYTVNKVDIYGYVTTVAGNTHRGYMGDLGPATAAEFLNPSGIAIDGTRRLYIGDGYNIRQVCCMSSEVDNPPLFTRGNSATLNVCTSSGATNIDSLLTITDLDVGQTETWAVSTTPTHGALGGFTATTTSTGGLLTPPILTYSPTPGYSGTDHFIISVSDGIDQNTISVTVNVNPLPNAGSISGVSTMCAGTTANLSESTGGGSWSAAFSFTPVLSVSTGGAVTGVHTGTSVITYAVTNGCGTAYAIHAMTVHVTPTDTLAPFGICQGDTVSLALTSIFVYPDVGGAVSGAYSSSSPKIAVDSVSGFTLGSGVVVIGISPGLASITYTLTNGCRAISPVTVNPTPNAGSITGVSALCAGSVATLFDAEGGGTWSSHSHATVTTGGTVTGVSSGIDSVAYSVSNSCGTAVATHTVLINPLPNAGTITGANSVCASSLIVLSDSSPGGIWSSINPRVSVGVTTGVVVGIAPGAAIVYYTVSNVCGTAIDSTTISVVTAPWAGTITGFTTLCDGDSTRLVDTVSGGAWSSGNPFVASISSSGELHGNSVGATFISYTVSNACGNAAALAIVDVNAFTPIDGITGASTLCTGLTTPLSDGTPGGSWSSSDTDVARISSSGVVSGISAGVAAISYSVNAGCGVSVVTSLMNVEASPSAGIISGPSTLCAGNTSFFTSTAPGGMWSRSNAHANISAPGIITGLSTGTDIVTYSVSNSCGTATATQTVSIYSAPVPGTITGASSTCAGTTIPLADTASGGVWTSSNTTVAIISGTGVVDGVAGGTTVISYAVATGCGLAAATKTVIINATNAGFISGVTTLCAGGVSTLSDATTGGIWSSSSTTVATVGSSTGVVNALAPGSEVIFYTITGPCGPATASTILTVGSLPTVSPVIGAPAICVGSSSTFTDGTLGGTWSSSNLAVAAAGSTGSVAGVSAGTAMISYVVTGGCGAAGAVSMIQVETMPSGGAISFSGILCQGSNITLTESISGGSWASSNAGVAAIGSATGLASGLTPGTATITYTVSNICGSSIATNSITISPLPDHGSLSGAASVCAGNTLPLTASVPGGTWASSNGSVATVGTAGIVSGISAGDDAISYTVLNSCGSATATKTITVNPLPYAGNITGDTAVCAGDTTLFSDSAATGVWTSNNLSVATVSGTGVVRGISRGNTVIFYTVTNSCGADQAHLDVTVNAPYAGTITGITTICSGDTTILSDSVIGGIWSSSVITVANIGSTGIVRAIAPGTTRILYTAPGLCGSDTVSIIFTVGAGPSVPPIAGSVAVCRGDSSRLTDGLTGGAWSSANSSVATIDAAGYVTGISPGTSLISYLVYAGCGSSAATIFLHVDTAVTTASITGNTIACKGTTDTLMVDKSGGTWSSSNTSIASINSNGVVTTFDTGSVVISYYINNSCGNATRTFTQSVISIPYPGIITGNSDVCDGSSVMLTDVAGGGSGAWSSSVASIATVGSTGIVFGVSPGVSAISYALTNSCGTGITSIPVTVFPLPGAGIINGPATVCKAARFSLEESNSGGTWTSGNAGTAIVGSLSGLVNAIGTGTSIITYTTQPNSGNCINTTTFVLNVVLADPFNISATISPVSCFGGNSGNISIAPGVHPRQYGWSNGDSSSSVNNLYPGVYTVYVRDLTTYCTSTDSFTVTSPDSLAVTSLVKNDTCSRGGSIFVEISGGTPGYSYLWSNNQKGNEITGLSAGQYSLVISDKNNCERNISFDVAGISCGGNDVTVHDVITPNGDGVNDVWIVEGLQKYPENMVRIFDKAGDLVYQKSNYNNNWSGQADNGNQLPDGTYFYVIKLNAPSASGGDNVFKGAILIKR